MGVFHKESKNIFFIEYTFVELIILLIKLTKSG